MASLSNCIYQYAWANKCIYIINYLNLIIIVPEIEVIENDEDNWMRFVWGGIQNICGAGKFLFGTEYTIIVLYKQP